MKTRTLYDVLQIAPNAAPPIVDAAYEHLRTQCDLGDDPAAGRLVDDAYATLRNPEARHAYDARLARLALESAQHTAPATPARSKGMCRLILIGWAVVAAVIGYGTATVWHGANPPRADASLDTSSSMVARPLTQTDTRPTDR